MEFRDGEITKSVRLRSTYFFLYFQPFLAQHDHPTLNHPKAMWVVVSLDKAAFDGVPEGEYPRHATW